MLRYSFPKLFVLVCTSLLLVLAGCDQSAMKKESPGAEKTPEPTKQEKELNAALDAMAKDVAAALESRSVRTLIKKETGKLLAGQHNVLFQTIASKKVDGLAKNGEPATFEEVLAGQRASLAKAGKALSRSEAAKRVRGDAATIPKFDIGVPVNHKKWDPKTTTPLVAFHHRQEIDDTKLKRLKAYDAEGNVRWLDAQKRPEQPVVVVGVNERTTADGKLLPAYRGDVESKRLPCCGGDGGGGGGGSSESLEYGDEIYLNKVKINKDKEPPWKGDPEPVFKAKDKSGYQWRDYRPEKRNGSDMSFWDNSDDKSWITHNTKFYTWKEKIGGPVGWGAYEYDPGNLDASFDAGPISISYTDDSDKYGGVGIQIGNDVDRKYDLGGQKFVLKAE